MKHIENISALFSKSFVEHPLIETFSAGELKLTSGRLVACDPLITADMPAFLMQFPAGSWPLFVHKERESNCIAYVELVFSETAVAHWEMARCEGQHLKDLAEGEIFGYPVDSGMGCLMDAEAQTALSTLEQQLFQQKGDKFMGLYEEFFHKHFFQEDGAVNQYSVLQPGKDAHADIFAFETGYGEGFYATYLGTDANGIPVKVISEFIEIV